MTLEVNAVGVTCNLACTYCYEHPVRDAGNFSTDYDLNAIIKTLDTFPMEFSLFGGEALLMNLTDLDKIWSYGYDRHGSNGIQTNGALITPEHIELFKKYKVNVGISVDGPEELNDARWAGTLEKTREMTQRTMNNIEACIKSGVPVSIICTLHQKNAIDDKLEKLKQWFRWLSDIGIGGARLHDLEVDHPEIARQLSLTPEQSINALIQLTELEPQLRFRFDVFDDIKSLLRGEDQRATCVWKACDPFTTPAVQGVGSQGQMYNCQRSNKDGVDWIKSSREGTERYIALGMTPFKDGGCKGCRFFMMCKGCCPGGGIDYDWRNRSSMCATWYALFEKFEQEMIDRNEVPLSRSELGLQVEKYMFECWKLGISLPIHLILNFIKLGMPPHKIDQSYYLHGHSDHYDGEYYAEEHLDTPEIDHQDFTDDASQVPESRRDDGILPHGDNFNVHGDESTPHGDKFDTHGDNFTPHGDKFDTHGDGVIPHTDKPEEHTDRLGRQHVDHGDTSDRHRDRAGIPHGDSSHGDGVMPLPHKDHMDFAGHMDKAAIPHEDHGDISHTDRPATPHGDGVENHGDGVTHLDEGGHVDVAESHIDKAGEHIDKAGKHIDTAGAHIDKAGDHMDHNDYSYVFEGVAEVKE